MDILRKESWNVDHSRRGRVGANLRGRREKLVVFADGQKRTSFLQSHVDES